MAEKSFGVKEINLIGASGTPTIESPNNINLTAVNVAMSNNASVAGNFSVTGTLTGNGSNLTNLPAANLTGTLPAISGANLTNLPAANLTGTLPAISGANLTNLPTVGPATSDIQVAYELLSTSSSSNGYRISGNGVDSSTANPDLYLVRGQKYRFINNSGGTHPFRIQSNNGSTLYSTGVTNNNASTGNIDFAPPNDAPQQLYYKCGNHSSMLGNIYIVGSFSKLSVSGQSDIVVDNLSSTMTFVAGSNMTITTNAASNAVTFAAAGGGGALEFVSKTTISSNTTYIDLTGLSYDTVYKLIIKRLEWTGYSQRSLLIKAFINGNSSVAGSIHDYSIDHPGTSNTAANSQSGWDFYQYGGENEHVTGTLEFYTGYYGYIRGPVHHVGLSNGVRYSHLYGTLNDASAPTNRISGLRLTNTGGQDWVSGGQVLLYKYKES